MARHLGSLLFALVVVAPAAAAQVLPVGPFSSPYSEGFETQQQPVSQACIVDRVFSDNADLCVTAPAGAKLSIGWNFKCLMLPRSGARFFGSSDGYAVYTFDTPVRRFGGYLGTNAWDLGQPGVVTVRFYGSTGSLLDSVQADVADDCSWTWNGWESLGEPILTVELENSTNGGAFVHMDDMEADPAGSGGLGSGYCGPGNSNSVGLRARLFAGGSDVAADNDLFLVAVDMPPGHVGFFLTGQTQGFVPNPGGSQGNLCIVGDVGRFLGQVQSTGMGGTFGAAIDLTNIPPPAQTVVQAGETWNYQAWYRDHNPGPTSNFTDGRTILYQ